MTTNRPRRQKKGDRLLHPDALANEIQCDYALGPMDRLAVQMDEKWGIDRLPDLVSPATAAKYGAAMAHLRDCIRAEDPGKCSHAAENVRRGLMAMDAEATAAGAKPASSEFWEVQVDGDKFGIMRDGAAWKAIKAQRPDLTLVTLREVALALQAYNRGSVSVKDIKHQFPDAKVTAIRLKTPEQILQDDCIPF